MSLYIGPIMHSPSLCSPETCPGPRGCWCADCERGQHPERGEERVWCSLRGQPVDMTECATGCAAPEERPKCWPQPNRK